MKPLEVLLLAVLGGFAATFLILTKDYGPTAALFPRLIAIACLLILAISQVKQVVAGFSPRSSAETERGLKPATTDLPIDGRRGGAIFALQAAYIAVIYLMGFFVATLLFLLIAPIQLRYKRWGVVLVHGVGLTLVLAGSFLWLFNIQLPTGVIWDLW